MAKFAVIGLGKFGMTIATDLFEQGAEVIAIDNDEKLIEEVKNKVSIALPLDSTDEKSLKQINVHEMDAVILAIGNNIEVSVLTCALLKNLGAARIYAKVDSKLHARILELIGVHHIVFPEEEIGIQLSKSLLSGNVLQYVRLSTGHTVAEIAVPKDYVGKTLQEIALPNKFGIHVVAIKYDKLTVTEDGNNVLEKKVNELPGANDVINDGDILVLLGAKNNIDELIKEFSEK